MNGRSPMCRDDVDAPIGRNYHSRRGAKFWMVSADVGTTKSEVWSVKLVGFTIPTSPNSGEKWGTRQDDNRENPRHEKRSDEGRYERGVHSGT